MASQIPNSPNPRGNESQSKAEDPSASNSASAGVAASIMTSQTSPVAAAKVTEEWHSQVTRLKEIHGSALPMSQEAHELVLAVLTSVNVGAGAKFSTVTPQNIGALSSAERTRLQAEVNMALALVRQQVQQLGVLHAMGLGPAPPPPSHAVQTSASGGCRRGRASQKHRVESSGAADDDGNGEGRTLSTSQHRLVQEQLGGSSIGAIKVLQGGVLPMKKRRRNFAKDTSNVLKQWFFEHILHPYPDENEKVSLATETNLTVPQVSYWFVNARKRIWQPLLQAQRQTQALKRLQATTASLSGTGAGVGSPAAANTGGCVVGGPSTDAQTTASTTTGSHRADDVGGADDDQNDSSRKRSRSSKGTGVDTSNSSQTMPSMAAAAAAHAAAVAAAAAASTGGGVAAQQAAAVATKAATAAAQDDS